MGDFDMWDPLEFDEFDEEEVLFREIETDVE